MPVVATVTLPSLSLLPEDDCTNSWVIDGISAASDPADIDATQEALADFYNGTVPTTAFSVSEFISPVMSRAEPCIIRYYNLVDLSGVANMGSPFSSHNFTLDVAGGQALPSEVSACLQLEAVGRAAAAVEVGQTRPKQRLTGRVWIGPLSNTVVSIDTNKARLSSSFRNVLTLAASHLHDELRAVSPAISLGVWSRENEQVMPLEAVSVDNAFDTQTRRGEKRDAVTRVLVA